MHVAIDESWEHGGAGGVDTRPRVTRELPKGRESDDSFALDQDTMIVAQVSASVENTSA